MSRGGGNVPSHLQGKHVAGAELRLARGEELFVHGNTNRDNLLAWDTALGKLLDEVLVWDDIVVQIRLWQTRNTGLFRHHKIGRDMQLGVAFEGGKCFGREEVHAYHNIETVVSDIVVEFLGVEFVGTVDK